jgi:hypothetical protein
MVNATSRHGRFNPWKKKDLVPLVIDGNMILKWVLNRVEEGVLD